ncbi:MAG: penicillin-binding protein, partial [Desulfobacterales bacterium]|nr:penicillin-binding protein [Desulfobacterales bacterium]
DMWIPRNADREYHGIVTLKDALAHSYNAATVNLADQVTLKKVIETAQRLGIKSEIYDVHASALGASELTLIELVSAYAAFDEGRRIEPVCIDRVIDPGRQTLIEPSGRGRTVVKEPSLSSLRKMLRAVIQEGTGRRARVLNRPVYGKTGTTTGGADALFIGFDDKIAVGVWVGKDRRDAPGRGVAGASAALPIWIEVMQKIGELGKDKREAPP